jgi:hypothetical protein
MEWWHYVLIAVGVLALGALKLVAWKRIKSNRSGKGGDREHPDED